MVFWLCGPRLETPVYFPNLLASPTVWLRQEGMLDRSMLVHTPPLSRRISVVVLVFLRVYISLALFLAHLPVLGTLDHDTSGIVLGSGLSYKMTGYAAIAFTQVAVWAL